MAVDMNRYFRIFEIFTKLKKIQFDDYTKCNENTTFALANITLPGFGVSESNVSICCIVFDISNYIYEFHRMVLMI